MQQKNRQNCFILSSINSIAASIQYQNKINSKILTYKSSAFTFHFEPKFEEISIIKYFSYNIINLKIAIILSIHLHLISIFILTTDFRLTFHSKFLNIKINMFFSSLKFSNNFLFLIFYVIKLI